MEVTTWVKRRQSNTQAVTQVKRLSSVKRIKLRADKVRNLEGISRQPLQVGRWVLETSAESKGMA